MGTDMVASLVDIGKDIPGYALSVFLIVVLWQGVKVLREEMRNNREALRQATAMYSRTSDRMQALEDAVQNLKITVEVGFHDLPQALQKNLEASIAASLARELDKRAFGPFNVFGRGRRAA